MTITIKFTDILWVLMPRPPPPRHHPASNYHVYKYTVEHASYCQYPNGLRSCSTAIFNHVLCILFVISKKFFKFDQFIWTVLWHAELVWILVLLINLASRDVSLICNPIMYHFSAFFHAQKINIPVYKLTTLSPRVWLFRSAILSLEPVPRLRTSI
jgi:hypothetical protein